MNNSSKPKAALVEVYDSHDVNLYSQLAFLKFGGYDVTLIVSEKQRKQVADYHTDEKLKFVNCTGKKGLSLMLELLKIRKYLIQEKFEVVIFNTAHGTTVRNLCLLPFPKRMRFFGTLHGVNKLQGSTTQKLISTRIKNYFLLSDYMLAKAMKVPHDGLKFAVFYPMFHPEFKDVAIEKKQPKETWICIPGAVEYKRRDYQPLLENFAALSQKPNIRFVILGNGHHKEGNGKEIQERVQQLGIAHHFIFFNQFVSNDVFHKYVKTSDAILPLIHPVNADMGKYLENQISGSFHLAYSYKLPLIMHDYFSKYEEFANNSIFYNLETMQEMLQNLPRQLQAESVNYYQGEQWSFAFQAKRYVAFLR